MTFFWFAIAITLIVFISLFCFKTDVMVGMVDVVDFTAIMDILEEFFDYWDD